ncbi:MAG: transposase, partial [Xanthomonadales bacterium]|nr:transposase [Xanthomonadales bacterium]
TKDAERALATEPQLANRFDRVRLSKWKLNQDYFRFLMSFEKIIPLKKPSCLHEPTLANKLHSMSEGFIGELTTLTNKAAIQAVRDKSEHITIKTLNKLKWIKPSGRKAEASRL